MRKNENLQLRLNTIKKWKERFKGRNITEIAEKAKVSRATIYYSINGDRIPNAGTINRIEEALNE